MCINVICNLFCRYAFRWRVGRWSKCGVPCESSYRTRTVVCLKQVGDENEFEVADDECKQPKPDVTSICTPNETCAAKWTSGAWTEV